MNQLKDIKKLISSTLEGGDILFIVPPFAIREYAVLAPHILQVVSKEKGYKAEILYASILLASILGDDTYDKISKLPYNLRWMKLGERLFARSAHGLPPLGRFPESAADEAMCFTGSRRSHAVVSYEPMDFDLVGFLEIEAICCSFIEELVRAVLSFDYKIIGCTTTLEQNNSSIAILKKIKKVRPGIITHIGGSNCERQMAEGIASLAEEIDHVFSGESEISFGDFLNAYAGGKRPDRRIITGERVKDLNTLPLPDYEDFIKQMRHFHRDKPSPHVVIAYETSRGCWRGEKQKCSFCGGDFNSLRFRQKSEEKVIQDLGTVVERFPEVTGILMTDNIVPHSYYKKLLPFLAGKKDFPSIWYQENTKLTLHDLINLKKARIQSVLFGIDAISTSLLKLMNKGVNASRNLLVLRGARSVGIYIIWHMLWGFPGDTAAQYEETLKLLPLIRHFQPPADFVHLILHRFCSYVENPAHYGVENLKPLEIYKHIYPEGADIDNLAYELTGDYPGGSHENPSIIKDMVKEIALWKQSWRTASLTMIPLADRYAIADSRELDHGEKSHILDRSKAEEVMRYDAYRDTEYQRWAVEQKLGVVVDSSYVPLVTASPELLLEFGNE
jgi:ribosomal peptide maturation radical SAM protein 1